MSASAQPGGVDYCLKNCALLPYLLEGYGELPIELTPQVV